MIGKGEEKMSTGQCNSLSSDNSDTKMLETQFLSHLITLTNFFEIKCWLCIPITYL